MTKDKLLSIVTAGIGFGVLSVPHFQEFVNAVGGDAEIKQAVIGAYAIYQIISLGVHWAHGKMATAGVLVLALLLPGVALAQEPATPVEGEHGAAWVSYGMVDGGEASLDNLQFAADLRVPGTVLSFTGKFADGQGIHAGGTGTIDIGPINLFGRHLFLMSGNEVAATMIGNKTGGGVEIPLPKGAVLRLGIHNHSKGDSGPDEFTVGFGARF